MHRTPVFMAFTPVDVHLFIHGGGQMVVYLSSPANFPHAIPKILLWAEQIPTTEDAVHTDIDEEGPEVRFLAVRDKQQHTQFYIWRPRSRATSTLPTDHEPAIRLRTHPVEMIRAMVLALDAWRAYPGNENAWESASIDPAQVDRLRTYCPSGPTGFEPQTEPMPRQLFNPTR